MLRLSPESAGKGTRPRVSCSAGVLRLPSGEATGLRSPKLPPRPSRREAPGRPRVPTPAQDWWSTPLPSCVPSPPRAEAGRRVPGLAPSRGLGFLVGPEEPGPAAGPPGGCTSAGSGQANGRGCWGGAGGAQHRAPGPVWAPAGPPRAPRCRAAGRAPPGGPRWPFGAGSPQEDRAPPEPSRAGPGRGALRVRLPRTHVRYVTPSTAPEFPQHAHDCQGMTQPPRPWPTGPGVMRAQQPPHRDVPSGAGPWREAAGAGPLSPVGRAAPSPPAPLLGLRTDVTPSLNQSLGDPKERPWAAQPPSWGPLAH